MQDLVYQSDNIVSLSDGVNIKGNKEISFLDITTKNKLTRNNTPPKICSKPGE